MTANDHQVITDVLNNACYQTNDVDDLRSLMIEDYRTVFAIRGYSLRTIILVRI